MRVCVYGLWHLGLVTAASAATRFQTSAFDPNAAMVSGIAHGELPIQEPGLNALIADGLSSGRLRLDSDAASAVRDADVIWVTFDTPVDDHDRADVEYVARQIRALFPLLVGRKTLLLSSQVPAGFCRRIEEELRAAGVSPGITVAYSPENLRLGTALDAFLHADRAVIGYRHPDDRERLIALFSPFATTVIEMSVESAEMTKHALNAFLATSLSFINEIAAICERTGADATDVSRGLRSDARVGGRAYVTAGPGFAGGTLARDVSALTTIGDRTGLDVPLLRSLLASNAINKDWPERKLREHLEVDGSTIAILGLAYKPHTNTLRRSSALELAKKLVDLGANVRAFDPAIGTLEAPTRGISMCRSVREALTGAEAAVIATEWPEFSTIDSDMILTTMKVPLVVDSRSLLGEAVRADERIRYYTIGRACA